MRALLLPLLFVAASAQAQQSGYAVLQMPPEVSHKKSTLVDDVARAYAPKKEPVAMQDVVVDPGRQPSVVEVSPGVLALDFGKAPVVVQQPVPTADPAPQSRAMQQVQQVQPGQQNQGVSQQTETLPGWRVGLYGGAKPAQQDVSESSFLRLEAPLGRTGVTVAVPMVKAAVAAASANSTGAGQATPSAAAAVKETVQKLPAPSAMPLKDWPQVR